MVRLYKKQRQIVRAVSTRRSQLAFMTIQEQLARFSETAMVLWQAVTSKEWTGATRRVFGHSGKHVGSFCAVR
jgi:hypothetical protein